MISTATTFLCILLSYYLAAFRTTFKKVLYFFPELADNYRTVFITG